VPVDIPVIDAIAQHYQKCWDREGQSQRWDSGPTWQLPPDFRILVFPPTSRRQAWTYATCGMSGQTDTQPVELHLFSPVKTDAHVELLTIIAHYHGTGTCLGLGHTVNFGRPWLPGSSCDRGLISLPYLDGPELQWGGPGETGVQFLWLIPVTNAEVEFKKVYGLESLEAKFEEKRFDYLDPLRPSVTD
jgi:hypothetical protein